MHVGSERRRPPLVGVLALQGDVDEHIAAFEALGVDTLRVKTGEQLEDVDGLVIPGGESTTVIRLLDRFSLAELLVARVRAGMPLWGTCMGMIVAASGVAELDQQTLGLIDITVRRNAFGRQLASEEAPLAVAVLGTQPFPAIFIRAPWIERAGTDVTVLASHRGHGVFVRQGNVIATSFHPELTTDRRIHAYFLEIVRAGRGAPAGCVPPAISA